MSELARLLLFVAIAGSAVTFLGSLAIWYGDEDRRIRRALRNVLRSEPEGIVFARGRGRGAGFSFSTNLLAVAWDRGAWCLLYRLEELVGAELLVDGQVMGRVFRGEGRRAIDHVAPQAQTVTLRLIFDDPRHPDFALELWAPGDELRRESRSPAELMQEANRWLARCEAIVRRPLPPRPAPKPTEPAVASPPSPPQDLAPVDPGDDDDFRAPPQPLPDTPPPLARRPLLDDPRRPGGSRPGSRVAPVPAPAPAPDREPDMFGDPPWDEDEPTQSSRPQATPPTYQPVSKARRETSNDQDELPFDLDD
ncbi:MULTISPECIES: hypothetical protein [unclassified Caulobacter]|uniref:hypothetical protein n=1 Tax=unclassified Caulobacter TaxID=2648921 RepID=UPI0007823DA8|nr:MULTISPECIES: hypothetical protein [unclassified Caulobacter]AZS21013.1 hypothetical protein CSW63_10340 [Caulobacter sp. FWC26]